MKYIKKRKELIKYCKKMKEDRLSVGTSGNLSIYIRKDNCVLITPSGLSYEEMQLEDLVLIDLDGNLLEKNLKPSSEWQLHTLFYKNREDINAIVHTHSIYCTSFACLRMPILPIHYQIAGSNSYKVNVSKYARYGSDKLARYALEACYKSNAVLLANHGLVTVNSDIKSAYSLAKELEFVAEIQHKTMSVGKGVLLSEEEIDEVKNAFKDYGQK